MAGFFLNLDQFGANVIKELDGEILPPLIGNVVFVIGKVANHLVDAVNADCREVVAQGAEITLGEREQTVVNQSLNQFAFDFQRCSGEFHQFVNAGKQTSLVAFINITQTSAVYGNDADRTGLLGRTEQAVAAGQQFAQVKLQAAAH